MEKKEAQTIGFVVAKKLQVLKKKIFEKKKNLLAYLCGYDLQNAMRNFFKNKWFSRYLGFGDFKVKNCSSH